MGGFYYFNITKIINPDDAKTYSFSLTCNFVTSTDVVNDTISFPNSLTFQPLPFDSKVSFILGHQIILQIAFTRHAVSGEI